MAKQFPGYIPNVLGGITTTPTTDRRVNEVADARNVLFSPARGAFRRPGVTDVIRQSQSALEASFDARERQAMWTFPVQDQVLQVLLLKDGEWELFWVDLRTNDYYQQEGKGYVAPDAPDRPIPPVGEEVGRRRYLIQGRSPYLDIPAGRDPHEFFRVQRLNGRLFILNRSKTPAFQGDPDSPNKVLASPDNSRYNEFFILTFFAVTSGLPASVEIKLRKGVETVTRRVVMGEDIFIDQAGERFRDKAAPDPENPAETALLSETDRDFIPSNLGGVRPTILGVAAYRQGEATRLAGLNVFGGVYLFSFQLSAGTWVKQPDAGDADGVRIGITALDEFTRATSYTYEGENYILLDAKTDIVRIRYPNIPEGVLTRGNRGVNTWNNFERIDDTGVGRIGRRMFFTAFNYNDINYVATIKSLNQVYTVETWRITHTTGGSGPDPSRAALVRASDAVPDLDPAIGGLSTQPRAITSYIANDDLYIMVMEISDSGVGTVYTYRLDRAREQWQYIPALTLNINKSLQKENDMTTYLQDGVIHLVVSAGPGLATGITQIYDYEIQSIGIDPDELEFQGKKSVALLRAKGGNEILDITFKNIAASAITGGAELPNIPNEVPTFPALPAVAPGAWKLKVRGNVSTQLDDVWVQFRQSRENQAREYNDGVEAAGGDPGLLKTRKAKLGFLVNQQLAKLRAMSVSGVPADTGSLDERYNFLSDWYDKAGSEERANITVPAPIPPDPDNQDSPGEFFLRDWAWEEVPAPGAAYRLDPATMPLILENRQNEGWGEAKGVPEGETEERTGVISLPPQTGRTENPRASSEPLLESFWKDRLAGNRETVFDPTFIGYPIQDMAVIQNRLVMLTADTVVASTAGIHGLFFGASAQGTIPSDPIDLDIGNNVPAETIQVIDQSLVVLTPVSQWRVFATDGDIGWTPENLRIGKIGDFPCNLRISVEIDGATICLPTSRAGFSSISLVIIQQGELSPVYLDERARDLPLPPCWAYHDLPRVNPQASARWYRGEGAAEGDVGNLTQVGGSTAPNGSTIKYIANFGVGQRNIEYGDLVPRTGADTPEFEVAESIDTAGRVTQLPENSGGFRLKDPTFQVASDFRTYIWEGGTFQPKGAIRFNGKDLDLFLKPSKPGKFALPEGKSDTGNFTWDPDNSPSWEVPPDLQRGRLSVGQPVADPRNPPLPRLPNLPDTKPTHLVPVNIGGGLRTGNLTRDFRASARLFRGSKNNSIAGPGRYYLDLKDRENSNKFVTGFGDCVYAGRDKPGLFMLTKDGGNTGSLVPVNPTEPLPRLPEVPAGFVPDTNQNRLKERGNEKRWLWDRNRPSQGIEHLGTLKHADGEFDDGGYPLFRAGNADDRYSARKAGDLYRLHPSEAQRTLRPWWGHRGINERSDEVLFALVRSANAQVYSNGKQVFVCQQVRQHDGNAVSVWSTHFLPVDQELTDSYGKLKEKDPSASVPPPGLDPETWSTPEILSLSHYEDNLLMLTSDVGDNTDLELAVKRFYLGDQRKEEVYRDPEQPFFSCIRFSPPILREDTAEGQATVRVTRFNITKFGVHFRNETDAACPNRIPRFQLLDVPYGPRFLKQELINEIGFGYGVQKFGERPATPNDFKSVQVNSSSPFFNVCVVAWEDTPFEILGAEWLGYAIRGSLPAQQS